MLSNNILQTFLRHTRAKINTCQKNAPKNARKKKRCDENALKIDIINKPDLTLTRMNYNFENKKSSNPDSLPFSDLCGEFSYIELYKYLGYPRETAHVLVKYPCYFEFKRSRSKRSDSTLSIKLRNCSKFTISETFNVARNRLVKGVCVAGDVKQEHAIEKITRPGSHGAFVTPKTSKMT